MEPFDKAKSQDEDSKDDNNNCNYGRDKVDYRQSVLKIVWYVLVIN